ncbi:MAG: phosphatase PAP2 family protein [Oscillospiraceae bacterium]|nr:phosphatase PAP2 family protein [Oscillospiraceae bacterium]
MNKNRRQHLLAAVLLLAAFLLWTAAVCTVDVQPIGPQGSAVGLAALNVRVHHAVGVHLSLYRLTDILSILPLGMVLGFAAMGLWQWVRRKRLSLVERSLLALGVFYAATAAAYLLFERLALNCRPVLLNGTLETSYPSSTTLLALCVVQTSVLQLKARMKPSALRAVLCVLLTLFAAAMVLLRFLSGVHWPSDIVGGILLGLSLVRFYRAALQSALR